MRLEMAGKALEFLRQYFLDREKYCISKETGKDDRSVTLQQSPQHKTLDLLLLRREIKVLKTYLRLGHSARWAAKYKAT